MDPRDAELLAKLLPTFREEAGEHLRRIDALLTGLREELSLPAVEEIFREVHSLKGAARAVGARELETLCQQMEAVFAGVKKGEIGLERELRELLFLAADLAADAAREAGREAPAGLSALLAEMSRRLGEAAHGRRPEISGLPPRPEPPPESAPRAGVETLRIGAERIERVLVQSEELLVDRVAALRQAEVLRELLTGIETLRRNLARGAGEAGAFRRETPLQRLRLLLAEGEAAAGALAAAGRQHLREGEGHARSLGGKVDALLDTVREILMLPVSTLLEQFPRIVRDLARESGKVAELETSGGEIPVDRRILEELREPLLHLLRNAIDHGIERPEERSRGGKPERGRIRLEVTAPSPRRVLFTLSDDGRGMDLEGLKAAALRTGMLTRDESDSLHEEQIATLSFSSGVSTREEATTISGRGLGLPIAREKVERLGGEIHLTSRSGEGTLVRLEIPAALAAFRGILVRLGSFRYVFPAGEVERVLRLTPERLRQVENRKILELDGAPLQMVRLEEPLGLPLPMRSGNEPLSLVVASSRRGRTAYAVDEIIAEQEFLVRGLGSQLVKVRNFAGAVILGDGGIALILVSDDLIGSVSGRGVSAPAQIAPVQRKRVLVVEDSITSRTLLRNILEGAGYAVTTAVDGVDALQHLGTAVFDVVVSDVEMPRMDGFQLTRSIRESGSGLPVILVTGLDRPEEREQGLAAGADAYLVKSRFDQGNLLEILGRLA